MPGKEVYGIQYIYRINTLFILYHGKSVIFGCRAVKLDQDRVTSLLSQLQRKGCVFKCDVHCESWTWTPLVMTKRMKDYEARGQFLPAVGITLLRGDQ